MSNTPVAYTKPDVVYPGFVNFTPADDGGVAIHLRSDAEKRQGSYICGYAKDKGQHGRCTPGDERCNNYCNMAPEKGAMQSHPAPCEQILCGSTASLSLSADEWAKLKQQII